MPYRRSPGLALAVPDPLPDGGPSGCADGSSDREAADICQEVFLRVYRGLGRFRGEAEIATWIYRIALNEVQRAARAGSLRRALAAVLGRVADPPVAPSPEHAFQQTEAVRELQAVLCRLKPKQRAVFVLAELEELSLEEIATVVGTRLETVKSRLRHARVEFERLRRQRTLVVLRPWMLVLLGTLAAGTALAFSRGWLRSGNPEPSPPRPQRLEVVQARAIPDPLARAPAAPARKPVATARSVTAAARPIERPDLDWPPSGAALAEPAPTAQPAPAAHLVVTREGRRELRLLASASSVSGQVRGTAVHLRLEGVRMRGRIGEASVELWQRGRRHQDILVEGTIDGRESGFLLRATPQGHLLTGSIPGHTVRVELGERFLTWLPGCDENLPAVAAGIFEGRCASGRRARVELPIALSHMPVAQRMIVLAILLTETDPVFRYTTPRLFPAEE